MARTLTPATHTLRAREKKTDRKYGSKCSILVTVCVLNQRILLSEVFNERENQEKKIDELEKPLYLARYEEA